MKEYKLKINGNDYNVVINDVEETTAQLEVNGTPFNVEFEKPITKPKAIKVVKTSTVAPAVSPASNRSSAATTSTSTTGTAVTSPLPGVILEVNVKEGDQVKKGQKLMMLEAMKMENVIEATVDGTVKSIKANKGDSVLEGAALVIIG
jgi:glutaconyl-CoA/methylmalonyl-CoA decarboxylase subunit gamma